MRWLIQCPKTFTIAIGSICMVYLPTFTIKNPPFMWVNTPVIWILWDCHSRFLKVQKPPKPLSIQFVVPISGLARALLRLRFGDLRSVSHMQRITWGIFRKWLARLRQKLWDEKSFNHWNSTESETEHNHLYRHLLSSQTKKKHLPFSINAISMSTTKIHPIDLAKGQKHLSFLQNKKTSPAGSFICKREKPFGKKHLYELSSC